jgi:signal transduction histidine kinase
LQTLQVDWAYGLIILIIAVVVNIIAFFAIKRIGLTINHLRDFATKAENGTLDLSETYEFPQDELGDISAMIVNMYINEQKIRKERDENMQAVMFEEQEKQRIKHQLTNNINHEIKNPVHAIQACLETMVNNGDRLSRERIEELQEKAYGHVKQLSSLLQDISTITRITDASRKIERENVNINNILSGLQKDMEMYPIEKRMRLNINVPEKMEINGNQRLVESIFTNLMNNALSYSGGRDIFITATDEGNCYMFVFADNGIGVDKEHLSKLFERFYRIDSGRSRKMGGTGLGLSIVKNAILFHNGDVKVSNRKQGGLQFIFTLQKN